MLKNPECCHQTRPLSPETLRHGRPSLASQSTRTKRFKPEPNERTSLYSFLRRAVMSKPLRSTRNSPWLTRSWPSFTSFWHHPPATWTRTGQSRWAASPRGELWILIRRFPKRTHGWASSPPYTITNRTETDRRFRLAFSTQPVRPVLYHLYRYFSCGRPSGPPDLNRYWYPTAKRNPFVCSQLHRLSSRFLCFLIQPSRHISTSTFQPVVV